MATPRYARRTGGRLSQKLGSKCVLDSEGSAQATPMFGGTDEQR